MAAVKAQVATVAPEGEEGQGMIEYGLIIALISIAAIALLVLFKAPLQNLFSNAVSSLGG
jgi:pilus assembly protein Flp/PilA